MTPPKLPWTFCNRPGCETKLIFARRAGTSTTAGRRPYEYDDLPPFALQSTGAHVVIGGEAWTPGELIEHYQVASGGMPEAKARELVSGYPWHRPHTCDRDNSEPKDPA